MREGGLTTDSLKTKRAAVLISDPPTRSPTPVAMFVVCLCVCVCLPSPWTRSCLVLRLVFKEHIIKQTKNVKIKVHFLDFKCNKKVQFLDSLASLVLIIVT